MTHRPDTPSPSPRVLHKHAHEPSLSRAWLKLNDRSTQSGFSTVNVVQNGVSACKLGNAQDYERRSTPRTRSSDASRCLQRALPFVTRDGLTDA